MVGMWMSELASRSGVPVPTIKFYLREGLLPPGEAAGATRAHYSDGHVRRLRLVRALAEVGGLRLDDVRRVLAAVDDETLPLHEALASAHSRLSSGAVPSAASLARVAALTERRGWRTGEGGSHAAALARALDSLAELEVPLDDGALDAYAEDAQRIADRELAHLPSSSREAATEGAVVLTVLMEPVLLSLRRLAHAHRSSLTFGG